MQYLVGIDDIQYVKMGIMESRLGRDDRRGAAGAIDGGGSRRSRLRDVLEDALDVCQRVAGKLPRCDCAVEPLLNRGEIVDITGDVSEALSAFFGGGLPEAPGESAGCVVKRETQLGEVRVSLTRGARIGRRRRYRRACVAVCIHRVRDVVMSPMSMRSGSRTNTSHAVSPDLQNELWEGKSSEANILPRDFS